MSAFTLRFRSEVVRRYGIPVVAVVVAAARRVALEPMWDAASRTVAGKMELERTAVDLAGVVLRGVESAQREAEAKRIRVTTDVDSAVGPVMGNASRLEQIVGNIMANAIKFTPLEGRIAVSLDRHRGRARLRVADSGPGIAPDVLPHVFERFRQAESSSRRRHEGLGLGLAIVRHLVETHGGTVRADNGPAGGAILTVELPLHALRAPAAPPLTGEPGGTAPVRRAQSDGAAKSGIIPTRLGHV